MAVTGWPTDAGEGQVATESRWVQMGRLWAAEGVVVGVPGEMLPSFSAGQVTIQPGAAWINGHYATNDAPVIVPTAADGLVVLRYTAAGSVFAIVFNSGATVPTQTPAVYEIALARVVAGAMTDRRVLVYPGGLAKDVVRFSVRTVTGTAITTAEGSEQLLSITIPDFWNTYDLWVWGNLDQFVSGTIASVRTITWRIRVGTITGTVIGQSDAHIGAATPNRSVVALGGIGTALTQVGTFNIVLSAAIPSDSGQTSWANLQLFAQAERKT